MWIGRLLKEHDDKYAAIFPDFWLIQYHFVVAFCNSTAKHLKAEVCWRHDVEFPWIMVFRCTVRKD